MRSSDTPANSHRFDDADETPQGPADWSRETPSDDRLSGEVWRRLAMLTEQRELAELDELRELREADQERDDEP